MGNSNLAGEFIGGLIQFGIGIFGCFLWGYAVVKDAQADRVGWLLLDICGPPIAMIRGFYLFFIA